MRESEICFALKPENHGPSIRDPFPLFHIIPAILHRLFLGAKGAKIPYVEVLSQFPPQECMARPARPFLGWTEYWVLRYYSCGFKKLLDPRMLRPILNLIRTDSTEAIFKTNLFVHKMSTKKSVEWNISHCFVNIQEKPCHQAAVPRFQVMNLMKELSPQIPTCTAEWPISTSRFLERFLSKTGFFVTNQKNKRPISYLLN